MRRCYPAIALLVAVLAVISTIAPSVGAEPGFATPGQDEVLVLESENLQAFVRLGRKGDWCRQKANLNLYMRDDTVFGGDQRELKALLAELPRVLRSECSMLRNVGIRGFIAGKRIYRANITAINATPRTIEKILDRRIAAKYSRPVAPRADTVEAPEGQPLREDTARLFTEARNLGEQCDMLAAWTTRFFDEYPGFDVFANDVGEFEPRAANLFGDRLFVPLFGRLYDETEPAWRGQVFQQVYQRCPKTYRFTPGIGAVFKGGFSSYAARLNSETLLVKVKERREIRAWLERQLAELDGIPVSAAGLERVHELATDGPARISVLWPSEQTAFTSRVVARRSQLALRLADARIAALPVDRESLRAIDAILGATESYMIAVDDAPFATLRARGEGRREEIRFGLVEREIAALAAYPDELIGLAQILTQAQRLLETVGRAPPLPVIERYELARASRGVEIARAALPAFEAELALLPESFSGAEAAIAQFQSISDLLVSVVPGWAPIFEAAARERTRLIHDSLIDAAVARVSAAAEQSNDEGWRVAPRLLTIGAGEASPFAGTLAKDRAAEIISATAVWEANAIAEQEVGRFRDEVSALNATWASVNELDRMAVLIRQHEQAIPPLEGYGTEAAGRRAHVLDALAEMARGEIQTAGASYLDADDILILGERHARRFDDAGAPAKAADLRKFASTRAAAVVEAYLPAFEEELAGLEATRAKAAGLESAAYDFETQANRLPPFTKYRQAALLRAAAMRETVCDSAVDRAGLAPADERNGVLGPDEPMTLRKFVCTLDEQGHQVSEFASPGSLQVEGGYTLRVFRSDGEFVHVKLHKVEALPGQELLVGFAYGDVNQQQEIKVTDWRIHAGVLLGQRYLVALSGTAGSEQQQIAARLENSAALVLTSDGMGSGFFVNPTLLVTNRHVVEGSERIWVTSAALGKLYPGTLVAKSGEPYGAVDALIANSRDYALIGFEEPLPVEPLVVASVVNNLARVITAGYPGFVTRGDPKRQRLMQGDITAAPDMVFTTGEVSVVQARSSGIPMIIHTALFSHGNSGGPLVDMCERIIGVNTWILEDDKYTNRVSFFSISASDLVSFLGENGIDEFETTDEPCQN